MTTIPTYIGFDRCGLNLVAALDEQLDTLAELCRRGYADRVAHDRRCTSDWFPEQAVVELLPDWNYGYVQGGVLPGLRERGVTDAQIDQMMVRKPREFFAARSAAGGSASASTAAPAGA